MKELHIYVSCHKQVCRKDLDNPTLDSEERQTTSSFIAVSSNTQYMLHVACHVSHKDMLQHYFRDDNSTCLPSTTVNKILKILSVAVCLLHLLLTLS